MGNFAGGQGQPGAGGPGASMQQEDEESVHNESSGHVHGEHCSHGSPSASGSSGTHENQPAHKAEEQPPKKVEEELDEAEKLKNQGNEHFKKKDFQKALELYDAAIALKPQELLYYNNRAACYIELGDLDKAQAECEKALQIKEEHQIFDFVKLAKVYQRLGSVYQKRDDIPNALIWYEKSLVENNNKALHDEVRKLQKINKEREEKAYINPQLAEEANERGKEFFKKGDYPNAVKEYNEVIFIQVICFSSFD